MIKPILHVFLISHYCEKARWALDRCGIDYELNLLSPINHVKTARAIGAAGSGLPILQVGDETIQGSAQIVAWANQHSRSLELLINDKSIALEERFDDLLGVHIRRWYYSESLIDCPEIVRPVFAEGSGLLGRLTLKLVWPKVVGVMIKRMDLGSEQELESKAIVETELEWLDTLVSDGRTFLVGDALSNADIAAASLIAPMFEPDKHPASSVFSLPTRVEQTVGKWKDRPFARYLTHLYQHYR